MRFYRYLILGVIISVVPVGVDTSIAQTSQNSDQIGNLAPISNLFNGSDKKINGDTSLAGA